MAIWFTFTVAPIQTHLIALDKRTGKTVWQLNDPAVSIEGRTDGFRGNKDSKWICSFSTPILVPAKTGRNW